MALHMTLRSLASVAISLIPLAAFAQSGPRSQQTGLAAGLAENLSAAYGEIDALKAQLADAQAKLKAAQDAKTTPPADAAKP